MVAVTARLTRALSKGVMEGQIHRLARSLLERPPLGHGVRDGSCPLPDATAWAIPQRSLLKNRMVLTCDRSTIASETEALHRVPGCHPVDIKLGGSKRR